jgi:hypothetical protein
VRRRTMAEAVRFMAGNTRDPDGKRILLDIANSLVELAAWAAKVDAGMIVRDC